MISVFEAKQAHDLVAHVEDLVTQGLYEAARGHLKEAGRLVSLSMDLDLSSRLIKVRGFLAAHRGGVE